jgi:hypothetical protein
MMWDRTTNAPVYARSAPSLRRPCTSTSVPSPSRVTCPSSAERLVAGSRPTTRRPASPSPAPVPATWSGPNRRARSPNVVDAGVGAGSNGWAARSARRRPGPDMQSAPAIIADAAATTACPPLKPRSRSLIGPIALSRAAVSPATRSASRTAATPAAGVSRGSGAPIWTLRERRRARLAVFLGFLPCILATWKVPSRLAAYEFIDKPIIAGQKALFRSTRRPPAHPSSRIRV